jgi:hypothetical protein
MQKPEHCMKENEAQITASVLAGWKAAGKDWVTAPEKA